MQTVIIMLVVSVVLIGAFIGLNSYMNATKNEPNTQLAEDSDPNRLMITVSGEVTRPGTYSLVLGSTIDQLIQAAGGTTANADALSYFPSIVVEAKINYYVAPKHDNSDVCSALPITKVNVNSANAEELITLNGVSSSLSQTIVSHRASKGEFKYLEQLMDVSGIGTATYNKLRNYVVLRDA